MMDEIFDGTMRYCVEEESCIMRLAAEPGLTGSSLGGHCFFKYEQVHLPLYYYKANRAIGMSLCRAAMFPCDLIRRSIIA